MAIVQESRPGVADHVHFGGNYAQPSASMHAIPEGQSYGASLNWSGDRNAGQPVYMTTGQRLFDNDIAERFRRVLGETWERWVLECRNLPGTKAGADAFVNDRLNVYAMEFGD